MLVKMASSSPNFWGEHLNKKNKTTYRYSLAGCFGINYPPWTNIAHENPTFWWYLLGKMGIFMGYVSFREGTYQLPTSISTIHKLPITRPNVQGSCPSRPDISSQKLRSECIPPGGDEIREVFFHKDDLKSYNKISLINKMCVYILKYIRTWILQGFEIWAP